jgi:membrane fusion protein, multidrug efflux system
VTDNQNAGDKPVDAPQSDQERDTPKRKPRRWLAWIAGGLVIVAVVAMMHRRKAADQPQPQSQNPAPHIKVATASRGDIGSYIEALGNVTPLSTINLYSQVNGLVEAVHYTEGQIVHRGDPLIDIDPRPYEAQLQEAQGTLDHDGALLKQAEMDLARYKEASATDAIARQTYEDQELTVEQYRGTVKNDAGQVQYAQVQLSYCHLVSPINGRVGLRLVDPGNTIFSGSSSPIVVVTQLQPITVVFDVAEDDLSRVRDEITRRHGLPVDAYDRAKLTKIAVGKLLTLDNQIDTSTGTVRFRGQFDNSDLALFPNQFVNARLLVKTLQSVVLIPGAAIQHNGTQAFVYVVHDNVAKVQSVTELASDNDYSAVSNLNVGDVVATTGFDKLQSGARVIIQSQQANGSSSSAQSSGAGL